MGIILRLQKVKQTVFTLVLKCCLGVYQSGQMGQTVNLLVYAYGGSNPSAPTVETLKKSCNTSSGNR